MIEVRGLTWTPPTASRPVLSGIDLVVGAGERILLAGPSGAGKSTLLRALAGLVTPEAGGALMGTVTVDRRRADRVPGAVGLLTQDPVDSAVAVTAGRDTAFGPENLGLPAAVVADRVHRATGAAGFPYGPYRPVRALSGGERQRLALAGQLALSPRLLLLDEPLAMLDPPAAAAVHASVLRAVASRHTGLVVVDHHLDRWWADVDRLVVLGPGGVLVADGAPAAVLAAQGSALAAAGLWLPGLRATPTPRVTGRGDEVVLSADRVGVRAPRPVTRGRDGSPTRWALREATTALRRGSVTALTGPSGVGKSTLLTALAGLAEPALGTVSAAAPVARGLGPEPHRWGARELAARIAWTPQRPTDGFLRLTVAAEVAATPHALGRPLPPAREAELLEFAGLAGRGGVEPHRLSGGEQRRLAIVSALAAGAPVLLLDEPTVGQDRSTWSAVVGLLQAARDAGTAIGIATHDEQLVDALADTVTALADGADRAW